MEESFLTPTAIFNLIYTLSLLLSVLLAIVSTLTLLVILLISLISNKVKTFLKKHKGFITKLYALIVGIALLLVASKVVYNVWATPRTSDWNTVEQAILNCETVYAEQLHDLSVYVQLKNGRKLRAKEPHIDAIWYLVDEAEEICGERPRFVTE